MGSENCTVVFVGGFLGAGKTTLLLRSAELLRARGQRVGLLMNDQDHRLVDTQFAKANGWNTREVGGGCFCCRFSEMEAELQALADSADVIFAEPVGSCIDLVTTLVEPLRDGYSHRYRIAPATVLVDPEMAVCVRDRDADANLRYLFESQIQEADLLCTTKQDLQHELPDLGMPVDFQLSARTGYNVEQWLAEVLGGRRMAGTHPLKVDYQRYAEAEAALAWLNLHLEATTSSPVPASLLAGPLVDELESALSTAAMEIAHLKLLILNQVEALKVSICRNGDAPIVSGNTLPDAATRHEIAVNIRAVGDPNQLRQLVTQKIEQWAASQAAHVQLTYLRSFRPPPPRPEHLHQS